MKHALANDPSEAIVGLKTQEGDLLPDRALLKLCMDRISLSSEFARSDRMMALLRFIVAAAMAGRNGELTERAIGQHVFGKPPDWDPSLDTIVRSEARRLRVKLVSYYEGAGRHDPVRIEVPKGRYRPTFVQVTPDKAGDVETASAVPVALRIAAHDRPEGRRLYSALVVVLLLSVAAGWLFMRRKAEAAHRQFDGAFVTAPFTFDAGEEYSPAISPDGKTVAYVWDNGTDPADIYLRSVDRPTSRRLASVPGTRLYPSWSPDGRSVGFIEVVHEDVYVTIHSLDEDSERRVAKIAKKVGRWADDESPLIGDPGPVWTPDGKGLLFSDHDLATGAGGVFRTGLDGSSRKLVGVEGEGEYLYPRLSPDGTKLAYVHFSSHGVGELFLIPTEGGPSQQLTFDNKTIRGVAWAPDGHSIIFSSNRAGAFQLWSVDVTTHSLSFLSTNSSSAAEPAIASSGQWMVYVESHENWNIWRTALKDATMGKSVRLVASSGRNYDPRYSPDGGRIAFVSDRSGSMELWVADAEDKNPQQLTHIGAPWLGGISWSPRGDQIAFDARPDGRSAIFLIDSNGGAPKIFDKTAYEERMPAWSRSGDAIYFNSNRDGTLAIWRKSLVDGSVTRVSPHGMFASAAADRSLVYSNRSGELWSSALDGTDAKPIPGLPSSSPVMSWYLTGSDLYLTEAVDDGHDYRFLQYRSGRVSSLGTSHGALVPNAPDIAVSPDGRWLVYAKQDSSGSDLKIRRLSVP
jgi:Tol biopolymer transport system component